MLQVNLFTGEVSKHTWLTISAANARLLFNGCQPAFIRDVCHGRCCYVKPGKGPAYTTVPVEKAQRPAIEARGVKLDDGKISACGRCPFHNATGFCDLHGTPDKPRSCIISPWTLTKKRKLIVRNRYKLLKCYKAAPGLPAYKAFASGLKMIFGEDNYALIEKHFNAGGGDLRLPADNATCALVLGVKAMWKLDGAKHGKS